MAPEESSPCSVLASQQIASLIEEGILVTPGGGAPGGCRACIQPASLDLTLGKVAYRLQSSFLPQSETVREKMKDLVMYDVDLDRGGILERGAVYLVPLNEKLNLPPTLAGKANPKSSTGRLDVFTRVITDNCCWFDHIPGGHKGEMFLEIVPLSFTVKVKSGQTLNQLRLINTSPGKIPRQHWLFNMYQKRNQDFIVQQELVDLYENEKLLYENRKGRNSFVGRPEEHISDDGMLMSVDLDRSGDIVGYKAKKNSRVVELDRIAYYDADDFWERIHPPKNGRLILEPEEFYIFASKERIRVPLTCAAEMVEFDAGSGELRTHYAGFFDPGFGYGKKGEIKGTKAVLEVRPHDVPFIIEDGQILFKMKYEKMSVKPDIWYGSEIGSNYHDQTLRLAKQFRHF